jgi:hypothetical protein
MTQGQLDACEKWTGQRPRDGCPWAALRDHFVGRVLKAYRQYEKGQLHVFEPRISNRLALAVPYYAQQLESVDAQRDEEERRNRALQGQR